MKKFLMALIAKKEERAKTLKELIEKATTVDEVRSLSAEAEELKEEIRQAKEQLAALPADNEPPVNAEERGFNPLSVLSVAKEADDDRERRTAFMEFVCRSKPIPAELRDDPPTDQVIGTSDESAVIPNTILNEIVQKLESYGNIYKLVRKLNVKGGVSIPILTLKPTAAWVGESSGVTQKITATTSVTFSYFGLEVKIAQTLLANIVALDMFENMFIDLATKAIIKKIEQGIFSGSGSNQMLGILNDTRIPAGNKITIYDTDFTWDKLKKKVFAKMPKAYRNGVFVMAQSTFDGYIDGMVDNNGQPIGRVNYGIDGGETYRFGGKMVETVETDILPDFDSASSGDAFAVFGNFGDYAINSNMQLTVTHWVDHDTNEVKDKVMLICDGKVVDPNGFLILKKGVAVVDPG